jgi:septal ring factor EnvC (AmiA/AmiB activator)
MAQGLSKAEERRRETLEKKLSGAREKRMEIDAQIAELEAELAPLGEARMLAFEAERRDCMERLLAALGTHEGDFQSAGLDTSVLVPDLALLMPEVRTLAETLAQSARVQS